MDMYGPPLAGYTGHAYDPFMEAFLMDLTDNDLGGSIIISSAAARDSGTSTIELPVAGAIVNDNAVGNELESGQARGAVYNGQIDNEDIPLTRLLSAGTYNDVIIGNAADDLPITLSSSPMTRRHSISATRASVPTVSLPGPMIEALDPEGDTSEGEITPTHGTLRARNDSENAESELADGVMDCEGEVA